MIDLTIMPKYDSYRESENTLRDYYIEADMLKGNVARMQLTYDLTELEKSLNYAKSRIAKIRGMQYFSNYTESKIDLIYEQNKQRILRAIEVYKELDPNDLNYPLIIFQNPILEEWLKVEGEYYDDYVENIGEDSVCGSEQF